MMTKMMNGLIEKEGEDYVDEKEDEGDKGTYDEHADGANNGYDYDEDRLMDEEYAIDDEEDGHDVPKQLSNASEDDDDSPEELAITEKTLELANADRKGILTPSTVWDNWVILVNVNNLAEKKLDQFRSVFIPHVEEAGSPFIKVVNAHYYLLGIVFLFLKCCWVERSFSSHYKSHTPFVVYQKPKWLECVICQ